MKNFERAQRAVALDNLPKETRAFLMGEEFVDTLQKISKKHSLTIDKEGLLGDLVSLTVLGLVPRENFVLELEKNLGLTSAQIAEVVESVNQDIFLKIQTLMQETPANETPNVSYEAAENPQETDREAILAEIEDPTPVQHPISIAQDREAPAIPRAQEILPAPAATPATTKQDVARDFIATKLTETAPSPVQKKPYVDPYREALN